MLQNAHISNMRNLNSQQKTYLLRPLTTTTTTFKYQHSNTENSFQSAN